MNATIGSMTVTLEAATDATFPWTVRDRDGREVERFRHRADAVLHAGNLQGDDD